MVEPVIEVKDLVKRYDGREPVLDGISFSVKQRELVTVYGKSGCGKTTLLNILGGLDRPTAGEVRIDGRDIVGLDESELAGIRLAKIGFIFQDFNLLTDLTVRENVALPLKFSGRKDGGCVDELLARFEIREIADARASMISGGEAQRTAIARAFINEPKIILADEPTGNLDFDNTQNVISILSLAVTDLNATVILATHDLELAKHSTKRLHLEDGKCLVKTR